MLRREFSEGLPEEAILIVVFVVAILFFKIFVREKDCEGLAVSTEPHDILVDFDVGRSIEPIVERAGSLLPSDLIDVGRIAIESGCRRVAWQEGAFLDPGDSAKIAWER